MASWQSHLVSVLLKVLLKRRKLGGRVDRTRALIRLVAGEEGRTPRGVTICTADGAPVPAEWIEPARSASGHGMPRRIVLYLHGGAYLFCSPRTHRGITAYLARRVPARVLVPDYRLAPEHPFPAALEDSLACYRWLVSKGIPAHQITLAGDSAGGGLALATLLALRDAGEPLPAAAACLAPWVDLAATGESIRTNSVSDAWVYGEAVARGAGLYLGATPATHPLASPLYAELKGLPPLLIHVSDIEILRDDGLRFAYKAREAGVRVQLRMWRGLPHVWQGFVPFIPEARESLQDIAAFLAGH
jgi:acetyl esterase/lipase